MPLPVGRVHLLEPALRNPGPVARAAHTSSALLRFGSACGASAAPALLPPDPPRPLGSDSLREPEPRGSPRRGHPTEWPKGGRLYDRIFVWRPTYVTIH